ncbi:hypothetical protein ABBQ38_007867 [Trebouxia sp. C0009 RCD-2024]
MHQGIAEAHLWNLLPPDVTKSVLERLSFEDAWNCRGLSSCWASAVRGSVPVEVVIPAKRQNLRAKLQRLQTIASSTTSPNQRMYTFKLKGLVSVTDCSSLLTSLTKQGHIEAPCQVLIQLLPPEAASLPGVQHRLAAILEATTLLASNNIKVCITLETGRIAALPSPYVLSALAPVIQQFDSGLDLGSKHVLTDSHIRALLPGTCCITSLNLCWSRGSRSSLHLLANFGNLRQLELQLDEADGLRHLPGLEGLLELHLTIRPYIMSDTNCDKVLESNKDSLRHVSLSSASWDDSTYMALARLCKLRTFRLTVHSLRHSDVQVLAQLRPSQSMRVTIYKIDQLVARSVLAMQTLTDLTLLGQDLSSHDFKPQPRLQALTLGYLRMGFTELELLVQNYPSLTDLYLHKLEGVQFSPDTLSTILQLRQLNGLVLNCLEGMSAASLRWMEAFFRAQQSIGMAQPKIYVICAMDDSNQVIKLRVDYMRYPVLCGAEFDERLTSHAQRCWAKIARRSACVADSVLRTLPKLLVT